MDMVAILKHGHQVILDSVAGLSETEWNREGVCGTWSAKDIIGHLASVEWAQIEILSLNLGRKIETPHLEQFGKLGAEGFNTHHAELRRDTPYQDVLAEYKRGFEQLIQLVPEVPNDLLHQPGLGSFSVEGYSLADWLIHNIYGHKREHAAQIVSFREGVAAAAS
jgi:DinB superfamily